MARLLPLLLLLLALAAPARAQHSAPVTSPRATVTLLAEAATVTPGQTLRLLLRQQLAPGWHTYWENPGDAGAPTEITLLEPAGATAQPLQFPAPHRIPFGPLVNFGYDSEALFLLPISLPASLPLGAPVTITAQANWLVCEQLCIPEEGRFTLTLPVEPASRPGAHTALFASAEAAQPQPSPFPASLGFQGQAGALRLEGLPGPIKAAFFFPRQQAVLDNTAPQPLHQQGGTLTLGLTRAEAPLPTPLEGVLTVTDQAGARAAWLISATPGAMPESTQLPFWQALLFALLGGLILNAMPCVFPVLAMKAMALARLGGAQRAEIRAHALSYTAGVILSFLALGGILAAFSAGWGFQFTTPWFVAALAWLMLSLGLNMSGLFVLQGPASLGHGLTRLPGHAGSFCTGALAVLVATPCTAPFMAAALGATLTLHWSLSLIIFAGLGAGLAAPYAALAAAPALARHLPRPGPWMEQLRQLLAFPMYAAAAWLTWVLAQQAGPDGLLLLLSGAVLLGFAAWALGQHQRQPHRLHLAAATAALLAALALLPALHPAPPATAAGLTPFTAEQLASLRAEGRPVFINLTAAWCVTCKVNERVALHEASVRAAFTAHNVATLTGDWTTGAPAITALLRQHGRDGVPLYLYYPPGAASPQLLPQILTPGILLRTVNG